MVTPEIIVSLVVTSFTLFLSLLPVSYTFWHDKLLQRFLAHAESITGLGEYMRSVGAREVRFTGPFRILNLRVATDIEEPISWAKALQQVPSVAGKVRVLERTDYDRRVLGGLNTLAGLCFKRGYYSFVASLILFSALLIVSVGTLLVNLQPDFPLTNLMMFFLLLGVVYFVIYAASTFTEKDIGWVTSWLVGDTGYILDDRMWR